MLRDMIKCYHIELCEHWHWRCFVLTVLSCWYENFQYLSQSSHRVTAREVCHKKCLDVCSSVASPSVPWCKYREWPHNIILMTALPACLLEKTPPSLLPSHSTGHASLLDTGPPSHPTLPSYPRPGVGCGPAGCCCCSSPGRSAMSGCEVQRVLRLRPDPVRRGPAGPDVTHCIVLSSSSQHSPRAMSTHLMC